jgi:glycine cleavage system H lipoate-binding protein
MDMGVTNIFETKGIEYLLVIGYLVVLVGIWWLLREPAPAAAVARQERRVGGWFTLPEEYCFHQGHAWAIPENENVVKVGMDDFAHKLLGRPDAVKLPQLGTRLLQGERGWEIMVGSTLVGMLSPVEGEVVGVNYEVVDSPEILCSDPYHRGWLLRVRVPEQRRSQRNLLCGNLAQAWLEEQLRAMRVDLGLVLSELGPPTGCHGFAQAVAPDDWHEVASGLLLTKKSARTVARPARRLVGWFGLPDGYCFHQGHSWAAPQEGNVVSVGIDEFVGWLLGRPSGIELPEVSHYLSQGERGWSIKIGSKSVGMISPVEGEVVAVNDAVLNSPEILCSDPYGRGWLLKVRVPDHKRNQKNLLCGGLARAWMGQKMRDLRARALQTPELGLVLADGGVPHRCAGFARVLAPENWEEVVDELLLSVD